MAEIGLSVAHSLFSALNCSELKDICAVLGYKSELEDITTTVATVKEVLMDAESKVLTNEVQGYIDKLNDALYEADDLFDEFVTLPELNQLQKSPTEHSELFHKVRRFFSSHNNQASHASRMFHKVKSVQEKLNDIVENHQTISLDVDYEPICMRSEETCSYIDVKGSEWTHMLPGLSSDHSWELFEMAAFNKESYQQSVDHIEMVKIGQKIVEKYNNIPLAIKVVGSLLFGQNISTWRSFEKNGLAKIDNGENKIMSVLKLSYYNLRSSLKSCFRYCAVFPKGIEIKKELLINLWKAQGYIEPLSGGQSLKDAAEEHFTILLRRCFFEEVQKDGYNDIESVKIHDLMHDVAQEMGGGEVKVLSSSSDILGDRTRHIHIIDKNCVERAGDWSNLRTLINLSCLGFSNDINIGNWKSLRVLGLRNLDEGSSLASIGKLRQLRYLNLSYGFFEELPNSITELHNLEVFILRGCWYLRELPHDMIKLVKLSQLNLDDCNSLTSMPSGLDKLKQQGILNILTGDSTTIKISVDYSNMELVTKDMSEGYLSKIPGLKKVEIRMTEDFDEAEVVEAALEKLEPHPNLKVLTLTRYEGRTIPWWKRANNDSPTINQPSNLVFIDISNCEKLVSLTSFSQLPFLKSLHLLNLKNLEHIETTSNLPKPSDTIFFPSLQLLIIQGCEKWKGWFREEVLGDVDYGYKGRLSFPCLSTVEIENSPMLSSFPPCPSVKTIKFEQVNKTSQLLKMMMGIQQGVVTLAHHTSSPSTTWSSSSSPSSTSSSCLDFLRIVEDGHLESLLEFDKVFEMCASSLRDLRVGFCKNLTRVSKGLKHLTRLENLNLKDNHQLNFWKEDKEDIMAWKSLHQSLHSLTLDRLYRMTNLPNGMQYLTSLQSLELKDCLSLKQLPEWISGLSSLQSLIIMDSNGVEIRPYGLEILTYPESVSIEDYYEFIKRCCKPDGQDWPKIKHIPNIDIDPVHERGYDSVHDSDYEFD